MPDMQRDRSDIDRPEGRSAENADATADVAVPGTARAQSAHGAPDLTSEQGAAVEAALCGENVFITGEAGCGKTETLRAVVRTLKTQHGDDFDHVVAVTGSTPCAAAVLERGLDVSVRCVGEALSMPPGLYLGPREPLPPTNVPRRSSPASASHPDPTWEDICSAITKHFHARPNLQVLVIDEVSSLPAELLYLIHRAAARARAASGAEHTTSHVDGSGGLQLIAAGDFCQLGPYRVGQERGPTRASTRTPGTAYAAWGHAFEAPEWSRRTTLHIPLTSNFRASDGASLELLRRVRRGDAQAAALVVAHARRPQVPGALPGTLLLPSSKRAQEENLAALSSLGSEVHVFTATDGAASADASAARQALLSSSWYKHGTCPAPAEVALAVGAVVRTTVDLDAALAAGTRGQVKAICSAREVAAREGAPWEAMAARMVAAAGGRAPARRSSKLFMPLVEFVNGRTEWILPHTWRREEPGVGACTRTQIPLALSWARGIYDVQGHELDSVRMRLPSATSGPEDALSPEQVYFAVSRTSSLASVTVVGGVLPRGALAVPTKSAAMYAQLARGWDCDYDPEKLTWAKELAHRLTDPSQPVQASPVKDASFVRELRPLRRLRDRPPSIRRLQTTPEAAKPARSVQRPQAQFRPASGHSNIPRRNVIRPAQPEVVASPASSPPPVPRPRAAAAPDPRPAAPPPQRAPAQRTAAVRAEPSEPPLPPSLDSSRIADVTWSEVSAFSSPSFAPAAARQSTLTTTDTSGTRSETDVVDLLRQVQSIRLAIDRITTQCATSIQDIAQERAELAGAGGEEPVWEGGPVAGDSFVSDAGDLTELTQNLRSSLVAAEAAIASDRLRHGQPLAPHH
ncbi:unnamed protein product [Pedinophyceae sp. YPF-701]|nr:unnamed protein product [Pedinophyceae sp. YPF-701]